MATLVVKALDVSGTVLSGVAVLCKLTDLYGRSLHEFSLDGLLVQPVLSHTGSDGIATIELVPNASIQRDNTYYTVYVGAEAPVLILKGAASETLLASRVTSPITLGPAAVLGDLADVDLAGVISGQELQWNGTKWVPVSPGAPAAHATSHISGSDQLPDATGSSHGLMTASQFSKLAGVAIAATANDTDANLKARGNHTGTQSFTTITGLGSAAVVNTNAFEPAGAVSTAIASLLAGAPAALDTLDEIAAALADDASFSATITTALSNKQALNALLTQISGLSLATNDVIQYVGGVLTNRTMAQLKTVLALAISDVASLQTTLDGKVPAASLPAPPPDVQLLTSGSGNWTKPTAPTGCKPYSTTQIAGIAGSGGAGSGRRGAAGTTRGGGSGGGGGGMTLVTLPTSVLGSTEAYVVGVGGTGGAAVTTNDTNGNAGNSGTSTTFGSYVIASNGGGGVGGTATNSAAGGAGFGTGNGGAGGAVTSGVGANAPNAGNGANSGGAGGGAGGGITSADVVTAGNSGGSSVFTGNRAGGLGGTAPGGAGNAPAVAEVPVGMVLPAPGSGGGASSITGPGGAGASGQRYGGGGGGGGASVNPNNSGPGGDGGPGVLLVITR